MKRITALLLSLVMVFSLAACQSNTNNNSPEENNTQGEGNTDVTVSATGNHINACIASEPKTLDPNMEESLDGGTYAMHMFEGLMKYVPTGENIGDDSELYDLEISYGQAESYEVSENDAGQMVYTFTLRDGITWSDGEPVVAGDFEYSWKRLVNPSNAAPYGYLLDGIVLNASKIQAGELDASELGIAALDDKTFEVTLEANCPYFLELTAFAALVPLRADIIEAYGASWTEPENSISNGAFIISEWVHDSYIKMIPNEHYYDAASITAESITWWLNDSQTAMMSAYESGSYDLLNEGGISTDRITDLQASGDLFIPPKIGTYYVYLNTNVIPDWRVRAALTLAIDRDYMVTSVTQGGQLPATGLVPPGITTSDGEDWVDTYGDKLVKTLQELYPDYDLSSYAERCALAQALYQEAVDDGAWDSNTSIEYTFNTSDSHQAIAEAIQSDWNSVLGINCTLSNQDWNVYTTGLSEGKFGVARMGWIADYNDTSTYLELFTNDNSYNYGSWVSDEYTALITQAKALPGGAERDALMSEAEELLFAEEGFPIAPIYFYTSPYCRASNLHNVEYTALGYFLFHHATKSA